MILRDGVIYHHAVTIIQRDVDLAPSGSQTGPIPTSESKTGD